jgi:hypothetical protein
MDRNENPQTGGESATHRPIEELMQDNHEGPGDELGQCRQKRGIVMQKPEDPNSSFVLKAIDDVKHIIAVVKAHGAVEHHPEISGALEVALHRLCEASSALCRERPAGDLPKQADPGFANFCAGYEDQESQAGLRARYNEFFGCD